MPAMHERTPFRVVQTLPALRPDLFKDWTGHLRAAASIRETLPWKE